MTLRAGHAGLTFRHRPVWSDLRWRSESQTSAARRAKRGQHTTRVRQRIAIEIWSNYQDYICARLKFADPTPDKQRANEDEAVTNAAEQELHAQRYAIQAYLHRTHQPLELGV